MKIKPILFYVFLFSALSAIGQDTTGLRIAKQISNRIAVRMKDSLGLSEEQYKSIFNINMQLHQQKLIARQQANNSSSAGSQLQRIENTRDSLYKGILPEDKFLIYKQKKRFLISAN